MSDLELLDCGGGRRLERFGAAIVDRPAPAADWIPRTPPTEWKRATLRWGKGGWVRGGTLEPWPVRVAGLTLECRPAAGGQLGVFPEHAPTWAWLDRVVAPPPRAWGARRRSSRCSGTRAGRRSPAPRPAPGSPTWTPPGPPWPGLDATPSCRAWPRLRSAGSSRTPGSSSDGSAGAATATTASILDPPTYGHGNGAWQIEEHLGPLLADLAALVGPRPSFVLLSAHTEGFDADRLGALVREHFGVAATGEPMMVVSRAGSRLPLGAWAHSPVR